MDQPARPLRADAARNRARVLEVAYQTFAEEGLGVPIDEIARRAGVGACAWIGRDTCAEEELFFSNRRAFKRGEGDFGRLLSAITLV